MSQEVAPRLHPKKKGGAVGLIADGGSDPRLDRRANVFLMAVLCTGPNSCPIRIRNLSAHGALLEGSGIPREGSAIVLKRGSLSATGEVAWQSNRICGVRFHNELEVEEWVKRAGPVGQQRIDSAVAAYRDHDPSVSRLAVLSRDDDRDVRQSVGQELLQICERIAALPNMSTELAEELLKIEAAARRINAPVR